MIQVLVHAKYYGGTHIARCGIGDGAVRGSSTNCNRDAATLAAVKWFRSRGITCEVALEAKAKPANGWEITYTATIKPKGGAR